VLTQRIAEHMATAQQRELPPEVREKAKLHILDTVAAMVSGTQLEAAAKAIPLALSFGGNPDALVIGTNTRVGVLHAALANGMLAHADETDDSHAPSLTHPGCAIVPAALAVASRENAHGQALLRAVVAGYDVGPRIAEALGGVEIFDRHHSSHAIGGVFGAVAAATALLRPDTRQAVWALAYAVQLASGNTCWRRDPDHIEKAFDFGGMPAHNGVLAAIMASQGCTGVADALEGKPGLFAAHPATARPELAIELLGERYEVMRTAIKKWCVGSPIQAALDALELLLQEYRFTASEVERIVVALPRAAAPVVDNRAMPAVNLQHQLSLMLLDGDVTFHSTHDLQRFNEEAVISLRRRISIDPQDNAEFERHPRQAIVHVHLRGGRVLTQRVQHVRGTPDNPMSTSEVTHKAVDLMQPILGAQRAQTLADRILGLEHVANVRELDGLLTPNSVHA